MAEPLIGSVSEYVSAVLDIRHRWFPKNQYPEIWFRGSRDAEHALLPGAYRFNNCDEHSLVLSFQAMVPPLLAREPVDEWDWYYLMQHYGLPTRLLDWTESPLHALYFALESVEAGAIPCVWYMEPAALNLTAHGPHQNQIYVPVGADPDTETRYWLPKYCGRGHEPHPFGPDKRFVDNRWPLAVFPKRGNPRIVAQRGVFTVHGMEEVPIEGLGVADAEGEPRLDRILIDAGQRETMFDELWTLGINMTAVYPEPPSIAADLRRSYEVA